MAVCETSFAGTVRGAGRGTDLRAARALGVFRELLNDGVPQQVEAVDDGGGESQHLHTQQVDAVPDVAGAQVQGVGNTHIHVEGKGTDVEGHGYPAIPVNLRLQQPRLPVRLSPNTAHGWRARHSATQCTSVQTMCCNKSNSPLCTHCVHAHVHMQTYVCGPTNACC